jgi:predicted metal-dependent phosphoesterase TrpH
VTRPGWVRVDCHLHTVESGDAVTTLDDLAEQVQRNQLDVICITDHNVTQAAIAAAERGIGARVIVGEEIRTPQGDLIGLFLTDRIPYVLPLAEVTGLIRAQGGLIYLPHPFDPGRSSLGETAEQLCRHGLADIVEVFNAKVEDPDLVINRRAAELAARYGLPEAAGSDAHDPEGIGAAYLEMPEFDGPHDFLTKLAVAEITGEYRPHAIRYARRPAAPG